EVLRPGAIRRGVDEHLPDPLRAKVERQRWAGHDGIYLAVHKHLQALSAACTRLPHRPVDVPLRGQTDVREEHRNEDVRIASHVTGGNGLAFEITSRANPRASDQLHAACVAASYDDNGSASVDLNHLRWAE